MVRQHAVKRLASEFPARELERVFVAVKPIKPREVVRVGIRHPRLIDLMQMPTGGFPLFGRARIMEVKLGILGERDAIPRGLDKVEIPPPRKCERWD